MASLTEDQTEVSTESVQGSVDTLDLTDPVTRIEIKKGMHFCDESPKHVLFVSLFDLLCLTGLKATTN